MNDDLRLKVFISKSEQGRRVWQPLVSAIEVIYKCKIIWEQSEATNYPHPETLMEEMVKRSDVAIFLLTHETDGVFRELRLWHKHKAGNFSNALVLRDRSFPRDTVKLKSGFEVVDICFDASDPWVSMPDIFPAINKLLKEGSQSPKLPSWVREHNKLVTKYNWVVERAKVPVNRIGALFKKIANNPRYKGPEEWLFRINWNAAPDLDSYSNDTTCLTLFEALLQTDATQLEYELVFDALARVIERNDEPPRKLAAGILFSGCSMSTLEGIKKLRGNHPYEKNIGFESRSHRYVEQAPGSPTSLLLPKSSLIQNDNYERFLASQRLILIAVSNVCKYVQCSNVEITASHSFVMHGAPDSNDSPLLAMSCTATRTNKDSLAAISEVPVVTQTDRIRWYGQPHKKPTTEYKPHWLYHNRNQPDRVAKNLIVHFHPIALLDAFRKVHERDGVKMSEREFIGTVSRFFKVNEIDFHVYEQYEKHSSRSNEFGIFMRDNIDNDGKELSVIWKPNHGIWVFLDDRTCSDSDLVEIFLALDRLSQDAVQSLTA